MVKMYTNHGWMRGELPVGLIKLSEDERGLRVDDAEFTRGMLRADETALAVRHGTMTGLSIGYKLKRGDYKTKEGGRGKDIYRIDHLKEVSVVDDPADLAASIDEVKSALEAADSLKEIEAILRDAGRFSRADACALVARIKSLARGERDAEAEAKDLSDFARSVLFLG